MTEGIQNDFGGTKYAFPQEGYVVDRDDPERLGRVKVCIPGLCEPSTTWAFPWGTVGGGTKKRGMKSVPQVGAEVGVLFIGGDPDNPRYITGHWGKPDEGTEIPGQPYTTAGKVDKDPGGSDVDVHVTEWDRYIITVDERKGKESLRITDKVSGDEIEFDGSNTTGPGISITATAAFYVNVQGAFIVDAAQIVLNDRKVADGGANI